MKDKRRLYTFTELTEIGRKKFNLPEEWECFSAEVTNGGKGHMLRYGLAEVDPITEEFKEYGEEYYGHVPLFDETEGEKA